MGTRVGVVRRCIYSWGRGAFDAIGADPEKQLLDIPGHSEGDVALGSIDVNVHPKIFGALPVYLHLV